MGGDCLNFGCVPSKALLSEAKRAHAMGGGVDYSAAKDHVHKVIETIAPVDSQERFEGLGVTVLRDWARFTGPTTVVSGETEVTARRAQGKPLGKDLRPVGGRARQAREDHVAITATDR